MKRRINRKLLKGMFYGCILGIGWMTMEITDDLKPVEAVHIVQPAETFWDISEEYKEKEKGCRDIYLLEFQDEICDMNPWLNDNQKQVRPGDRIKIVYYIEKESASTAIDTDPMK